MYNFRDYPIVPIGFQLILPVLLKVVFAGRLKPQSILGFHHRWLQFEYIKVRKLFEPGKYYFLNRL